LAEPDRGAEAVPEAANDASRGSAGRVGGFLARIQASGPLGWALLLLALVAAVLLVVADFSEISRRTIGIGACGERVDPGVCRTVGHESHAFVLVVLAPAALLMAWGAVVGRSRAAAVALAVLGGVVLFIALAIDLPKLDDKRGLDVLYDAPSVEAHTGPAFKIELVGGVLLLLVGGLALLRARGEAVAWEPGARRRRRAAEAAPGDGDGDGGDDGGGELTGAQARARERGRRRAARSGQPGGPAGTADPSLATMPPPKPSDPTIATMPPPEPGSAARQPTADPAPPPEPAAEPEPPPESPAGAEPSDDDADLDADAYRKPPADADEPEGTAST
jgi:hypothetical protein